MVDMDFADRPVCSGRTILLGTRRPQAVAAAMEKLMAGGTHPIHP